MFVFVAVPDANEDYFVMPTLGLPHSRRWLKESTAVFDIVAAGAFDIAMQSLRRQIGAVNFAPMKPYFLDVHQFSQCRISGLSGTGSLQDSLPRSLDEPQSPAICISLDHCTQKMKLAYRAFMDQSQIAQAEELFRQVLLMLPLVPIRNQMQANQAKELVSSCREYILAARLSQARLAADSDKRKCEIGALTTHCKLQPVHTMLCLYAAIGGACKIQNFQTAGLFCRRFLEMSLQHRLPRSLERAPDKVCDYLMFASTSSLSRVDQHRELCAD